MAERLTTLIVIKVLLERLKYAGGAGWNPESICAPNTRVQFLDDVQKWIHQSEASSSPRILLLSNVAGSGKSAVAHSVARLVKDDPNCDFVSSFFFVRDTAGRNTPERFMSTLAFELASQDSQCAMHMSGLIEKDPALAGGSVTRLFYDLVVPSVKASDRYCSSRPVVVVVDALDEGGYDEIILKIIRDGFPNLPSAFRFFITSRPHVTIDQTLKESQQLRRTSFNLGGEENISDIRKYIALRSTSVLGLDPSWLDSARQDQLAKKTEGLFVWITVVFNYISDPTKTCDPKQRLLSLLEDGHDIAMEPEEKMDRLYCQILGSCPWKDPNFRVAFGRVVGTLVALETPLYLQTFVTYLGDEAKKDVGRVQSLNPLIAGLYNDTGPVCFIHLSVREFLTSRTSMNTEYFVDKSTENDRLTAKCLEILNQRSLSEITGLGYVARGEGPIPRIPREGVPECSWYACRFWKTHISHIQNPSAGLLGAAERFLKMDLTSWLELSAATGQAQTLDSLPSWIQVMGDRSV